MEAILPGKLADAAAQGSLGDADQGGGLAGGIPVPLHAGWGGDGGEDQSPGCLAEQERHASERRSERDCSPCLSLMSAPAGILDESNSRLFWQPGSVHSVAQALAFACGDGTLGGLPVPPGRLVCSGGAAALPAGHQGRVGRAMRLLRRRAWRPADAGPPAPPIPWRQYIALQSGCRLPAMQCQQGEHSLLAPLV